MEHQPELFSDTLRNFVGTAFYGVRLVSLGMGATRIQPDHSTRQYVAARLLGTHRVCVRTILHFAERTVQYLEGDSRIAGDFSGHAGAFAAAHSMEKAPG